MEYLLAMALSFVERKSLAQLKVPSSISSKAKFARTAGLSRHENSDLANALARDSTIKSHIFCVFCANANTWFMLPSLSDSLIATWPIKPVIFNIRNVSVVCRYVCSAMPHIASFSFFAQSALFFMAWKKLVPALITVPKAIKPNCPGFSNPEPAVKAAPATSPMSFSSTFTAVLVAIATAMRPNNSTRRLALDCILSPSNIDEMRQQNLPFRVLPSKVRG